MGIRHFYKNGEKSQKETMQENEMNPDQIFGGDIQDPTTCTQYTHSLREGQFDDLIAVGVMPYVENDDMLMKKFLLLFVPKVVFS